MFSIRVLRLVLLIQCAGAVSVWAQGTTVALRDVNFCPTSSGRPARVFDPNFHPTHIPRGADLVKHTLTSPEAMCNDGTPAVMYVRRSVAGAQDAAGQMVDHKWIIHLQEGGGCSGYVSCLERWCGTGFYDASKMTSQYAPPTMGGKGIFLRDPSNNFGNYNQVYVYYCSSDSWSGTRTDSVLSDPTPNARNVRLQFKGNRIVDAVFNELRAGLRNSQGQQILPPLDQATQVYFTGSSAGSTGARHNADRIGELVRQRMPAASFAVLTDAALGATLEGLSGLAPGNPNDPYTQQQTQAYNVSGTAWGAVYDQSCLQLNSTMPWRCSDIVYVSQNHITSPIFNRTDLVDSNNIGDRNMTLLPTEADFARTSYDRMTTFLQMRTLSPERALMTRDPGGYGPMCGVHITLDSDKFFERHVRVGGARLSLYNVLWNWVSNNGGPTVARRDRPPATPASPPYDPECIDTLVPGQGVSTVNAASFAAGQPVAPGSIASAFGVDLAPAVAAAATLPLPTRLLGTGLGIRDSAGTQRVAQLLAVSPTQVNFIVPDGLVAGTAALAVENGGGQVFLGTIEIAAVAPGLFSVSQTGSGVAAGGWERISANGQRTSGLLNAPGTATPAPIDLGAPTDQVFLTLYGTGFRAATQGTAQIGGITVPIQYAGPQGSFAGLDQLNLGPLPRALAGRVNAEIAVTANGRAANRVTVSFQ